jgi:hypothetical protein
MPLSGREAALALEPGFDFYRASKILHLEIDFEDSISELPSLHLDLVYAGDSTNYRLKLLFEGVRQLQLPEMTPSLALPELEIEDIAERGMEGIRLEAVSHFDRGFRCIFGTIAIMGFQPLQEGPNR